MALKVDGEPPIILDDDYSDGKGKEDDGREKENKRAGKKLGKRSGKSLKMCEGNSPHGAPCTT